MSIRKAGQIIAGSVDPDKYAKTDLSNLSATGESHFANPALTNSPYTTNRILEIPQDIKLELNNGTLTLKAGSKIYNGNGLITTTDVDMSYPNAGTNDAVFIIYIPSLNSLGSAYMTGESVSSLPTPTTSYKLYYNTTDRKCYIDNGTWLETSFPLAIAKSTTTQFVYIDQVFNGFGYIGSTVFVLPGVKVQAPNGKNEDGSYKVIESTTTTVVTDSYSDSVEINWYINGSGTISYYGTNYIDFTENNLWEATDGTGTIIRGTVFATSTVTSGVISNWKPHNVDSAANSNASNFSQAGRSYLSGLGMPSGRHIDLTLGASGTQYTAPANGWFVVSGKPTADGGYCILDTNNYEPTYMKTNINGWYDRGFIPVRKGQVITLRYGNYEIEADRFKFIYAEGEN